LIPKAITTTEKLEMTGQPINITNIEKKVKEEIDNISSKLQNVDYDKLGANAKSGAEKIGSGIGTIFMAIFKALAKVIGAIITVTAAIGLGAIIITFFVMLFTSGINDSPFYNYGRMFNHTDVPIWVVSILGLFTIGIPVFFIFLLGLKILVDNLKPIGNITKYTLLAIWLISTAFSIYIIAKQATEFGHDGKTMKTEQINVSQNDTLYIKFRHNEFFAKTVDSNTSYMITQDSTENDVMYSNEVELHFVKTDEKAPYMQVERVAEGSSISEARKRAEKISYNFELQGNKLILDNYLTTDIPSKFRNQKVKVFVYLPEGFKIHADKSIRHYHHGEYSEMYIPYNEESHTYQVEKEELKCLDCPPEEGNEDEYSEGSIIIRNDTDTIVISSDSIHNNKNVDVDINVNKDGLRFKTTTKKN
jgi:hypothetical protein